MGEGVLRGRHLPGGEKGQPPGVPHLCGGMRLKQAKDRRTGTPATAQRLAGFLGGLLREGRSRL